MSSLSSDHGSPVRMKNEECDDYYDEANVVYIKEETNEDDGYVELMRAPRKKKQHPCEICLKIFKTPKELKIHTRVHTNERPYKCKECDKAFKQQGALRDHINTHTGVRKYHCKICDGKFSTSSSLKRHEKKIHINKKSFACSLCSAEFQNKSAYLEHKEIHYKTILKSSSEKIIQEADESDGFKCTVCGKTFKRRAKLFQHLDVHSKTEFTCEYCGRTFTHLAYKQHMKKSHTQQACSICDEIFHDKKLYYIHKKRHFKVATDVCDYCRKAFSTSEQLKDHMESEHCKTEQMPCDVCCKIYRNPDHLDEHVAFAHVLCMICKKYFSFYEEMTSHFSSTHNIYKCSRCRGIFRTKSHLAFHLNTVHFVINKFSCKVCGKQFQRHRHLQMHREVHNVNIGEDESADSKDDLDIKNHVVDAVEHREIKKEKMASRAHQKNKKAASPNSLLSQSSNGRLRCQFCNKGFWASPNLYKHTLNTHGRYPCVKCHKTFFCYQELENHKVVHDKEVSVSNTCDSCHLVLSTPACLRRHILSVHLKLPRGGPTPKFIKIPKVLKPVELPKRPVSPDRFKKITLPSGVVRYKCDYCDETMAKKFTLRVHQYREHRDEMPPGTLEIVRVNMLDCTQCGKEFYGQYNLKKHMTVHERTPVCCEYCGISFKAKSGMVTHLKRIHHVQYKREDSKERKEKVRTE